MEARQLAPTLSVTEVSDRRAFLALEPEWNALVRATDDQIFYRHEFVQIWLDSFAPGAALRILTARDEFGTLSAVLPLVGQRGSLLGKTVRQLVSPANAHSPRCDLVARDPAAAAELFLRHLVGDRDWDVLRLANVPDGGAAWHLESAARALELATGRIESNRSPYRVLPGSPEALDEELKPRLRAKMHRYLRQLSELGTVTVERACSGMLAGRLREAFEIERSGWKGRMGTAIAQEPATRSFYWTLAHAAAELGWLSMYFLNLEGRPIAFDYVLDYGGRYSALKGSFDERYRAFSPGHVLTYESMLDCAGRGVREFDLLGQVSEAKQLWADRVRGHAWLVVFRSSWLGYALCPPGYGWMPKAQSVVIDWAKAPFE